ncbi:MAG: hypothetical protein KJ955_05835 [Nanoarchaeota archaeon]|nr:hypothetical protein [Nanoarchaeota archaeon]
MQPSQRTALYRGAVERYAQLPPEKPKIRVPWGLLIGLLLLIIVYYVVSKLIFR